MNHYTLIIETFEPTGNAQGFADYKTEYKIATNVTLQYGEVMSDWDYLNDCIDPDLEAILLDLGIDPEEVERVEVKPEDRINKIIVWNGTGTQQRIDLAKKQILADAGNRLPSLEQMRKRKYTYSDLHDHVDANCYGFYAVEWDDEGLKSLNQPMPPDFFTDVMCEVQDQVNKWMKGGMKL